jgi:hypothetical protein
MISDHISATMTYMIWREERLCDASVLQTVHAIFISTMKFPNSNVKGHVHTIIKRVLLLNITPSDTLTPRQIENWQICFRWNAYIQM